MTKKLSLSEFLSYPNIVDTIQVFQPKEFDHMSYSLVDFYKAISEYKGIFTINGAEYNSIIPSTLSFYFFTEATHAEYLLPFDPIIDIKQKHYNEFTIFYYPDAIINISLKDFTNVKEVT